MLLSTPSASPNASPLTSDEEDINDGNLYYVEGNPSPKRRSSIKRNRRNRVNSLEISNINLVNRNTNKNVPHLSEGYGFVGAFTSGVACVTYVAWALVPPSSIETWLRFRSAPSQYWAIALPVFAMVAVCFLHCVTVAFQLMRTPALHEKCTYTDRHSLEYSEYARDQSLLGTPSFMDIPITLISQIQSGTGGNSNSSNSSNNSSKSNADGGSNSTSNSKSSKSRNSNPRSKSRATIDAENELRSVSSEAASRSEMLSPPTLTSNPVGNIDRSGAGAFKMSKRMNTTTTSTTSRTQGSNTIIKAHLVEYQEKRPQKNIDSISTESESRKSTSSFHLSQQTHDQTQQQTQQQTLQQTLQQTQHQTQHHTQHQGTNNTTSKHAPVSLHGRSVSAETTSSTITDFTLDTETTTNPSTLNKERTTASPNTARRRRKNSSSRSSNRETSSSSSLSPLRSALSRSSAATRGGGNGSSSGSGGKSNGPTGLFRSSSSASVVGRSRQRMGHSFRRPGHKKGSRSRDLQGTPRLVSSQSHNSLKQLAMEIADKDKSNTTTGKE